MNYSTFAVYMFQFLGIFVTNFYIPWSIGMVSIRGFGAGHLVTHGNTVGRRFGRPKWW